eukprot:CAMPEP_0196590472 /NCGR_PEP_ID=MMETSP1081-20130531/66741_1 /TAXON_ID=36882 /ORGANISM="Pyramimonas amylifera, Strain CCMP720" /LENGTH=481 /DNA_ID=CAMNT_0041913589 /DNA_START=423 /DNA_END=1868 /DNA_ORIENTATION=+
MKSLPYVRDIVAKENAKVLRDLRAGVKEIHVEGVDPLTKLPKHKCDSKIVLQALRRLHSVDKEPELRTSTMSGTMYICDKKHLELLNSAYGMYALTNPLHGDCFPSVNRLEREVVGMTASILGGGPAGACVEACGTMTSGGTESIMTAVRTTRDFMCHTRGIDQPELVMAVSAHPAFDKACRYFGIKQHRIPVSKDYRADVKAMARAVNGNTIMLVVSAPGYPHGVMDPVEAAASVARAKKVCLHVDCCLGGFVLPFARKLGYNVPPFHFEVPGVTSISVDTHKYAMAQKGSSVVLYHSRALRKFQFTSITDWTGGLYVSPSHPGSRSGSLVAQTWAAMVHLGEEGYMEATKQLMEASIKLQKGIVAIPGLKLIGQPDMCLVAWTATNVNILELNDVMTSKGWTLNVLQFPNSVHMCLTMSNVDCVEMLIKDLQDGVNDLLKHGSDPAKGGKAPIYGMATSLPDRGAVNDILIMYQDVVCG